MNNKQGQFLIEEESAQTGVNFERKVEFGGLVVYFNSPLNVISVKDGGGEEIGLVLGCPIDLEAARLVTDSLVFEKAASSPKQFENSLFSLAGRFVALYASSEAQTRLYVDSAGSLSCLYNSSERVVASTIGLVEDITLEDISSSSDRWAKRWLEARQSSGNWFPGGLGPVHGWKVVVPNHYLDFRTWEVERHWLPGRDGKDTDDLTVEDTCREIGRIVGRQIQALTRDYELRIALTAGQDSRSLLACGRQFLSSTEFYINWEPSRHDVCDVLVGNLLAELFGLEYTINPSSKPQKVDLAGYGGGVGRAFYWHQRDTPDESFEARDVVCRLGYTPKKDKLDWAIQGWFEGISHLPLEMLFDLMYIEQRLGCCFGPVVYSRDQSAHFALFPFNHRRLYTLMAGLPLEVKQRGNLGKEIVKQQWEELGYVPYNRCDIGMLERASLLLRDLSGSINFPHRAQNELFRQYLLSPKNKMTDLAHARGVRLP